MIAGVQDVPVHMSTMSPVCTAQQCAAACVVATGRIPVPRHGRGGGTLRLRRRVAGGNRTPRLSQIRT
jgi:hypothetical protein